MAMEMEMAAQAMEMAAQAMEMAVKAVTKITSKIPTNQRNI
jgi:hypothetical protein